MVWGIGAGEDGQPARVGWEGGRGKGGGGGGGLERSSGAV